MCNGCAGLERARESLDRYQLATQLKSQGMADRDILTRVYGDAAGPEQGGAPSGSGGAAPQAPAGWRYVPKAGGGWTAVEDAGQ